MENSELEVGDVLAKIDKERQAWLDVVSYCQVNYSELPSELLDLIQRFNQARNESTYAFRNFASGLKCKDS